jgi:phosphatidylinositol-3-phosphatase
MGWPRVRRMSIALLFYIALEVGCGGGSSTMSTPGPQPTPQPPGSAQIGHVFLVVEENHSFSEVIGSSSMPYLNSLASGNGLATQYFADTHPSIGNYFVLTTGQIVTNNEVNPAVANVDNIVRELVAAGKTWKSYAEGLPSVGYTGGDVGLYAQHHNPFALLSDVVNSSAQSANMVPFTQFATDLANQQLPQFSYIVPDQLDNAHDGPLTAADVWLQTNIDPLVKSSLFQTDGLLIITFDESDFSDLAHGGGHIATVLVGPSVKKGFQSTTFYQHESALRLILKSLGVSVFPGNATNAPDMTEFFQ